MKLAAIFLLLVLTGCTTTSTVNNAPDNHVTLLLTVTTENQPVLTGSPSRLFDYQSSYNHPGRKNRVLKAVEEEYQLTALQAWPIKSLDVICQVFTAPADNITHLVAKLKQDKRVESVQLMNQFRMLREPDPYQKLQRNLDQIQTSEAHKLATGDGVTIAIIDTHIDRLHPELRQTISVQKNLTPLTLLSADNHGTAIAGIIAAQENNGVGIVGIAPEAEIMALTACWSIESNPASCNSFTLARALDFALTNNAQVINLSLGGPSDALLSRLVKKALAQNIIVVGAYDPIQTHTFPTSIEGVISVANIEHIKATVYAPGEEVLTTTPDAGYDFFSGHSFAAAHITGIAALALELKPALTPPDMAATFKKAININGKIDACTTLISIEVEPNLAGASNCL